MSNEKEVSMIILADGTVKMIYDDTVAKTIEDIGTSTVKRASNVEPSEKTKNSWEVNLTPVGGPTVDGFKTRKEALQFEVNYINENVLKTN